MATESPDQGTPAAVLDQPVVPDQPAGPVTFTQAAIAAEAEADTSGTIDGETPESRCPWCSAGLALGAGLASCPSCGAQLSGDDNAAMPGLTQVVPVAMKKALSTEPVRRSRLLAWISGDMIDEPNETAATAEALALPSRDVRREILRIELESAGIPIPPALLAGDPAADAEATPEAAADATLTATPPVNQESTAA
jgi:hypothetical protein